MKKVQKRLIMFLSVVLIMMIAYSACTVFFEYVQIAEIGEAFTYAFWINFGTELVVQIISLIVVFVFVFINMLFIRNNLLHIDSDFSYLKKNVPMILVSLIIAFGASIYVKDILDYSFLLNANSEWFNLGDPVFHQDVGYYVFQRPFYMGLLNIISNLFLLLAIFNLLAYVVLYAKFDFYSLKSLLKQRAIVAHVIVCVATYFLIVATSYKFQAEQFLFSQGRMFAGMGYTDSHVWMPYYKIIPYILLAIVAAAVFFLFKKRYKLVAVSVAVYPMSWLVTMLIAATVQGTMVAPNELTKETPYIEQNIAFTRAAYGLQDIIFKDYEVKNDLNSQSIMNNLDTVDNIRVIDYEQTLKAINQNQIIKSYYDFYDADISTYNINGKDTAVFLAAREINSEKLDQGAKNYTNTKLKYTHGAGVVMNPVNAISEDLLPYSIIKDLPTRSIDGAPQVKEPRIYFGELTNDYVITNTTGKELDDIEADYAYKGSAGVPMNFMNRLMFCIAYGDFNMLVSGEINDSSKLLLNRNVVERVKKVAPFLAVDSDPYITIDEEGGLKWIIDAYTTTEYYPYAQKTGSINYIKNTVKAVVDAYDGTVKLYIIDYNEPIIKAYARIYPTIFEKVDELPPDLTQHPRYPEHMFKIQADILQKYHATDAAKFYQKDSRWAFAREKTATDNKKQRDVMPYYNVIKLQVEEDSKAEFVLMTPFTIERHDNMVAWLAARCDMNNYGQLVCYQFPTNQNIYGPAQIQSNIESDINISADLTLWSSGGSNVVRGNIMVIPIENSLLYVEPIYLSATGETAIPQLKRVVVAYGDKVVMSPTIHDAFKKLFNVTTPQKDENEPLNATINNTVKAYNDYKKAAAENNWEEMGKSLKALEDAMGQLEGYGKETNISSTNE